MRLSVPYRLLCVCLALALSVSCSKPGDSTARSASADVGPATPEAPAPISNSAQAIAGATASAEAASEPRPEDQLSSSALSQTDGQRKFVRTANLRFRVQHVYRSALALEDLVASRGGFVAKNKINAEVGRIQTRSIGKHKLLELAEYTLQGHLTIRVPSDQTQSLLRAMAQQIDFLDQRNFESMDVQFRLLREALAYQRFQSSQQDLTAIAQQGGKVDQRAAVIGARTDAQAARDEAAVAQQELADKVAFSTITIAIYQPAQIRRTELTDVDAILDDSGPTLAVRLTEAMHDGWRSALDVFVFIVNLWPIWLLLGLLVFVYLRLRKAPE